jgi:hypothetical protein
MSLRDSVHQANATSGAEDIWLPAWDFVLTLERSGQPTDIEPSYGDLHITDSLTVLGVKDFTKVAWRTSAVTDEVFELVGDYDSDNAVGPVGSDDEGLWPTSDGNDNGVDGETADYNAWFDNRDNVFSKIAVA